jgi:hypothetical protein
MALLATCLILSAPVIADAPLVYATIEPAKITLGESAKYTITDLGKGTQAFSLPVVAGLDFQVMGRTQQIEIINGTTLASTAIVVRVTPQVAGIFTIPPITPKAQPLVLQVNADHAAGNSSGSGKPGAAVQPPILARGSLPSGVRLTEDGSAFLRLSVPRREVYVGEHVPVEIELGMRSGFVTGLHGLPKLTGDELTLNNLSTQPERGEKLIDGQPFVLLTWRSALAVVKPGTFSLSAEAPLTVKIRTQPRQKSLLDDMFGDPFLQRLFGTTVPKDINVTSPPVELKVLALPEEGRPPDFHGAVGSFTISSNVSPAAAEAGEPLTLRMRVTGSGNFDRVDSGMLEHLDQWKTYPPKSSFSPSDAIGVKGEKTFEQPLIALKAGTQSLPGLAFSYFDPAARRYETARSAPLSVTIAPSLADSTLSAPQISADPARSMGSAGGLRGDHVVAGNFANSLLPLYLQPRFLVIPSLLALAFAGGWLGMRRRMDASASASARSGMTPKAIDRALAQMEAAARAANPSLFFNLARSTVLRTLGARWQMAPDQITTAELAARLGGAGEDIRQLLALADESNYSGRDLEVIDFAQWTQIVRRWVTAEMST